MAPKTSIESLILYFDGKRWILWVTSGDLQAFWTRYNIPSLVVLEVPRLQEHVLTSDGVATRVALYPLMFANGVHLPFCCPILEVSPLLGIGPGLA